MEPEVRLAEGRRLLQRGYPSDALPHFLRLAQLYPDDLLAQARLHACQTKCARLTNSLEDEQGGCTNAKGKVGGQIPPASPARSSISAGSDDSGAASSMVTARSHLPSPICHEGEEQHSPSAGNATAQPCQDDADNLDSLRVSQLEERLGHLAEQFMQLQARRKKRRHRKMEAQCEERMRLASLWQQEKDAWARVSRVQTEVAEWEAYVTHLEATSACMWRHA